MSPSQTEQQQQAAANTVQRPEPIFSTQPAASQSMDYQKPAVQSKDEPEMGLRGGEACPGRFCFIIPCPIPCDFCVFPCPC
ncbi:hypothetical protein B0H63DRAFT_556169 [Podospora didyma]|uniref:Uncharacterized protein n=1 Tax=Podospora didyma TaxID=330526 RepID=A0AAE0U8U6_9PEZI|nr:hypothetical protein B0H63DRAFT_556169 [Podospora didyma]